jgi:hypothetical protein
VFHIRLCSLDKWVSCQLLLSNLNLFFLLRSLCRAFLFILNICNPTPRLLSPEVTATYIVMPNSCQHKTVIAFCRNCNLVLLFGLYLAFPTHYATNFI